MSITVISTRDCVAHGLKICIYGFSGVGKTSLAATIPGSKIILSAEAGLLCLKDLDIPAIVIESPEDLDNAHTWLEKDKQGMTYQTIVIDSVTEIAEQILDYELEHSKDGRMAYGAMGQQMRKMVKAFRDFSGRNVIFIAQAEKQKDENVGATFLSPSFPGQKLGNKVPYYFDACLYMKIERDGRRVLQTAGDFMVLAKDRSGELDAMEEPDLEVIFTKMAASKGGSK